MFLDPKRMGARLASLEKIEGVRRGVRDDAEQKLLDMEDIARDLNSFENYQHQRLSRDNILLFPIFVNALPPEYNVQKQLLEDREDPRSPEIVMVSILKRSESVV